jgi:heme exporter protein C
MFIHVPAAWLALFAYAALGGASFASLIWRHALGGRRARGLRRRSGRRSRCWRW